MDREASVENIPESTEFCHVWMSGLAVRLVMRLLCILGVDSGRRTEDGYFELGPTAGSSSTAMI
jgi:hypothetical protein